MENTVANSGNAARYAQVKISINPGLASAFKAMCAKSDVSMASVLTKFMSDYCLAGTGQKPPPEYVTRRQRRATVSGLLKQLGAVKSAEERYMDKIPPNLQGSVLYDNAEQAVSLMEDAINALDSVYQ